MKLTTILIALCLLTLLPGQSRADACLARSQKINAQLSAGTLSPAFAKSYLMAKDFAEARNNNMGYFYEKVKSGKMTKKQYAKALYAAISNGRTSIAIYLLESGAPPNMEYANNLPLMAAVRCRNLDLTKYLLYHGANPNTKEYTNNSNIFLTSFSAGIISHQYNVVRWLLEYGYNLCTDPVGLRDFKRHHVDQQLPAFLSNAINNATCK